MVHASRERRGMRWWWHLKTTPSRSVSGEFYWWSSSCGVTLGVDDDGWTLGLRLPPFAFYLSLEGFGLWRPTCTTIATWDNDRVLTLVDQREFSLTVHDWAVWFAPWGRSMESRSADPWWIHGVVLHIDDLVLGKVAHECVKGEPFPCVVPMPEGVYAATATPEHRTRTRPRWFRRERQCVWLEIPKGIPHAGKGENSWDCGDDGLFGIGGDTLEDAVRNAQQSVTRARSRYGRASDAAMREALS